MTFSGLRKLERQILPIDGIGRTIKQEVEVLAIGRLPNSLEAAKELSRIYWQGQGEDRHLIISNLSRICDRQVGIRNLIVMNGLIARLYDIKKIEKDQEELLDLDIKVGNKFDHPCYERLKLGEIEALVCAIDRGEYKITIQRNLHVDYPRQEIEEYTSNISNSLAALLERRITMVSYQPRLEIAVDKGVPFNFIFTIGFPINNRYLSNQILN